MSETSSSRAVETVHRRAAGLRELVDVATLLLESDDEYRALALVAERLPALCACALERAFLLRQQGLEAWPAAAERGRDEPLVAQMTALDGADGEVELQGRGWLRAYALRGPDGLVGYLVAAADREPPGDQQLLLRGLVTIAGVALSSAAIHRRAREDAKRLHWLVEQVDDAKAEMARYARVSEALARTVSEDGGVAGIARALHELTGRSVVVVDRFGVRTASAGAEPPDVYARPSPSRLAWRQEQVERGKRPVRDGDLLLALAAPYGEGLGALAMVDAERTATRYELFALEQAAMVLAMELSHRQRMLDAQHALERDLVDDLLAGLDDGVAIARAELLGHDLTGSRCVVLVHWQDDSGDGLLRAVEWVAAELHLDALVSRRDDAVVLVVDPVAWRSDRDRWPVLHERIVAALGSPSAALGVGGLARTPSELTRSHREAAQALAIRSASRHPFGVTRFDDLGVYRILAGAEGRRDVERFVREWLGKLIDYDAAHSGDMVQTLGEYCESGGNYDRTAHELGIHRSTLRYRLRRIRDLSGRDLNEVDARFNLHVATRAWRVLRSGD